MEKKIKLVDMYLKLNNNCQNPLKQIWPGDIKNVSHLDEAQFMLKGTDRQVVFKGAYKEAPWKATIKESSSKQKKYEIFLNNIFEENIALIQLAILEQNILPELYDQRNENAWLFACKNGKISSVETLKKYFDINYKNQAGESGLFFACLNGDEKLVRRLLELNAKADNKVLWAAKQNGNNKNLNRIKEALEKNPYI